MSTPLTNWQTLIQHFNLSEDTIPVFQTFYALLLEENQKVNLTRIVDEDDFVIKHIWDALCLLEILPENIDDGLIDIGTGGGFPGIPLWITRSHWPITLLDATGKKIKAIQSICQLLQEQYPYLSQLPTCIHARAESAGQNLALREHFSVAVSRAVALLPILLELCLPLVKPGGILIAMKGPNYHEEMRGISEISQQLGGYLKEEKRIQLPGDVTRVLLIFEKTSPTPKKYPRLPGVPAKKPLSYFITE